MKTLPLVVLLCGVAWGSDCIQVEAQVVRASDLAATLPAFAALPAETVLAYTPAPGLRRSWTATQLDALLARHGNTGPARSDGPRPGVCVERLSKTYTADEVLRALRSALPEGAHIDLVEHCRLPMPAGRLEFELHALPAPGAAPAAGTALIWRGRIRYEEHRSTPFWASVRVAVRREGYYAIAGLAAGHTLTAQDMVFAERLAAPADPTPERDPQRLVGLQCRRAVVAGAPLNEQLLVHPPDIARGDTVEVTAESGAARVQFSGVAAASGRAGDTILVENAATGKRVKAQIAGPGRATAFVTGSNETQVPSRAGLRAGGSVRPVVDRGQKTQEQRTQPAGPLSGGR